MRYALLLILGFTVFTSHNICAQGTETFTNMPVGSTASSYVTKNWVGDGSISWTSTDTRGDQSITGLAAGFRNSTLTSGNISGGIGNLSFKYKYLFTGNNASLTIKVNGNTVGTVSVPTSQTTATTATISNINVSGVFVLSVQQTVSGERVAIDDLVWTAYSGSSCTPPSTQASAASITGVTGNSMNVNWTGGNGTNSLVVVKAGSPVAGSPVSGTAYTANAAFGSGQTIAAGEYVVYNSTGNSVSVTGLSSGTTYHAAVYSFNSADNCYNTTGPATANATTIVVCTEPTTQANSITVNASSTTAVINWTAGNGSNSLVKINTANSFTGPSDGVTYTANTAYGGGEQVIYAGTGNSVTVTGLTVLTTYYVTVYTYNPCSSSPDYLASGNTVQSFSTINNTGEPANYYNSTAGLSCAALKTALKSIITAGHTQLNYSDLDNVQMPVTDDRLNDAGTQTIIWDIYSDNPTGPEPYEYTFGALFNGGTGNTEGFGWNKEHSFPNSWFSATSSTSNYPGADLHHLFPTDKAVNNKRGNMPYGVVSTASQTFLNGSKIGTSTVSFPGLSGNVFEPINAYKGDLARAIFYMVTRYQDNMASWENLQSGGDVVMDGTAWPSIESSYLQMLLNWHNLDPVSQKEIDRNNAIYGYQGNRNPFVDHPEYVDQIWGSSCSSLPADLISFNGKYRSGLVILDWNIANADRFSKFEVERSYDGRNFSTSGTVDYIPGLNGYAFNETVTMTGDIYYRLKMVDLNGLSKYSRIINVSVPELPVLASVYPNPAGDYLTVSLHKSNPVAYQVRITDLTGQAVYTFVIPAGEMNYKLPVSKLTAGLYVMTLKSDNEITHIRFVKQ